jgi:CBS domain-containing protein
MNISEIMTENPFCCTPQTALTEVARLMAEHHWGSIPVVESEQSTKLVGVITDRDIVCRSLAQGKNPLQMQTSECMSSPVFTVTPETDIEQCFQLMQQHMVRRIPVVDKNGNCCGIVSQADIAKAQPQRTAEVIKDISQPTESASKAQAA